VLFEQYRLRTGHTGRPDASIIAHFLFGPDFDHFARIGLAVSVPPPVLPRHVLVAVFEHENGSFVNLNGKFRGKLHSFILTTNAITDL
jgi:hypothetical protein